MPEQNNSNRSILTTTKKKLGLSDTNIAFDIDIASNINTVISTLKQMGVIDKNNPTYVESADQSFDDLTDDLTLIAWIIDYMYIKVKLLFDPPTSSDIRKSYEEESKQLEYRMYTYKGGY